MVGLKSIRSFTRAKLTMWNSSTSATTSSWQNRTNSWDHSLARSSPEAALAFWIRSSAFGSLIPDWRPC